MDFSDPSNAALLLVDNGSLQPAATQALRRIACTLSERLGRAVEPVSLLHSDKIPAAALDGISAETLEPAIQRRYATGTTRFLVLPLFFGASGALTDYIPRRVEALADELPRLRVNLASPVAGHDPARPDPRLAGILAAQVRAAQRRIGLSTAVVVLVDHGSPQRAVTALRDRLAIHLAGDLGADATAVVAASMERRDGAEFDFNEPLLERALAVSPCGEGAGDVVIAPLFFSAGRHAGPGGDVESIARDAASRYRGMRVHLAPLVGEHPWLIDVLADRYREAILSS